MQKKFYLLALIMSAMFLSSCWVTAEQGRQFQADLNSVREQNNTLKRLHEEDSARLLSRLSLLTKQAEALEMRIDELDKSAHRGAADIGIEVATIRQDLAALRGEIELTNYNLSQVGIKVEKLESVPPPPPPPPVQPEPVIEKTEPVAVVKNETPDNKAGKDSKSKDSKDNKAAAEKDKESKEKSKEAKEADKAKIPATKDELLNEAKKALAAGDHAKALTNYLKVARQWPNELGVTDRAFFGAGSAYGKKGDHRAAIMEFNKIIERFPKSSYVDDALLGIGKSFIGMGYKDDAKAFLEELINRHPKSPLVSEARKALKSIGGGKR